MSWYGWLKLSIFLEDQQPYSLEKSLSWELWYTSCQKWTMDFSNFFGVFSVSYHSYPTGQWPGLGYRKQAEMTQKSWEKVSRQDWRINQNYKMNQEVELRGKPEIRTSEQPRNQEQPKLRRTLLPNKTQPEQEALFFYFQSRKIPWLFWVARVSLGPEDI